VLFVLSSALRSGARRSLAANLGILSGNAIYFVLSATGVSALLMASYNLFFAIKWIGAAYLIFIGLRALFGKADVLQPIETNNTEKSAARLFADGLVVQLSNPKAIVFFSALLPQFIDPPLGIAPQLAILGVTSVIIEFLVLSSYGLAASRASAIARQPRYAVWTDRIGGLFLIGAGTGLATLKRTS
jgi:homoserine/homoserine lactone efflux protein